MPPRGSVSLRLWAALPTIVALVVVLGGWESIVRLFQIPKFVLPPPTLIVVQFGVTKTAWGFHTWITLYESLVGFGIGLLLAIVLAIAITSYKPVNRALYPLILAMHLMPKVALAPLLIIWFGYGEIHKIVIATLIAFFPMLINTAMGLQATEPEIIDVVSSLKASWWQTFRKVRFPNALPYMFAGMRVGITLAVIGAVVAEFVGADRGLGYVIILAGNYADAPTSFASITLLTLIGILLFLFIIFLEKLIIPWYSLYLRRS